MGVEFKLHSFSNSVIPQSQPLQHEAGQVFDCLAFFFYAVRLFENCGCWGHWFIPAFVTGSIIEPFKPMCLIRRLDLKVKVCWVKRVQIVGLEDGSCVPCPIPMLEKVVEHGGTPL